MERLPLGLLAAIACTCLVSIFAAQIFLALAILFWAYRLATGRTRYEPTPLDGPILAFAIWTLLSASFSPSPIASHGAAKKLVLFALFYLTVDALRREDDRQRVMDAVLLGGIVLAMGGLLQRYFLGYDTLANRPSSFLGHYMTASGLLMAVAVLAAAQLSFAWPDLGRPRRVDLLRLGAIVLAMAVLTAAKRVGAAPVVVERLVVAGLAVAAFALGYRPREARALSASLAALALPVCLWAAVVSRTRSAWLGAMAGLAVVAVIRKPRALVALAAAVLVVLALRPTAVISRLTLQDASSLDRIYMWQAGFDMIRDKPIFGQGPNMILQVYPEYRWSEAPNPRTPHLHDNVLQIAAERGLPALVWWLWWVAVALGSSYRVARRPGADAVWGVAAFAMLIAVLVAGLFEYNFGDSEILMLVLLVSALPLTLPRATPPAVSA